MPDDKYRIISSWAEFIRRFDDISVDDWERFSEEVKEPFISDYIIGISRGVKPETAIEGVFRNIADIYFENCYPQVSAKSGFVDYIIEENNLPPIVLEIKPLYRMVGKRKIRKTGLDYKSHEEQIKKYLLSSDYVILTNLDDVYIFGRGSLIAYEPLTELRIERFFKGYGGPLWDWVRRLEDQVEKRGLDEIFFEDLMKWYAYIIENVEFDEHPYDASELTISLINKFIFIKTLEDFGLIPFGYIVERYKDKIREWEPKGLKLALGKYFSELEEWFNLYYDTELFRLNVFDYVKPDTGNLATFKHVFEETLGLDKWNEAFGKGLLHYTYRHIDEDIFGKSYEKFLARKKKNEGIYYTPAGITNYMAEDIVSALFDPVIEGIIGSVNERDYGKAREIAGNRLLNIRIIDTACGSGSFLIKVVREIYKKYGELRKGLDWAINAEIDIVHSPDDVQKRLKETLEIVDYIGLREPVQENVARIILRHIFGIDRDPRAVTIAKTNIWKEAIKLEPQAFNFRKTGKLTHILPDLELNIIVADSLLDPLPGLLVDYLYENKKAEIIKLYGIFNSYLKNPFEPDILPEAVAIKEDIRTELDTVFPEIPGKRTYLPLEFFFGYFDESGEPLAEEKQGFSGLISNPPWEALKPVRKEFAGISKSSMGVIDFEAWFDSKLEEDEDFKKDWIEYESFYRDYSDFVRGRYKRQGSGDLNYYKVFTERNLEIIRRDGFVNILLPSGIQTDEGSRELRKLILVDNSIRKLLSFENKGCERPHPTRGTIREKIFPGVHPQYKFTIVDVEKSLPSEGYLFDARFYMHCPEELEGDHLEYNLDFVKRFSADNLSIIECRNVKDMEMALKIRSDFPLFGDLDFELTSEFHMTNDSKLFEEDITGDALPLFEGKMVHQYDIAFEEPRFFVRESAGREKLLNRELLRARKLMRNFDLDEFERNSFIVDYETERLAYRAIGRSTDERTLIASILPADVFTANSLILLRNLYYDDSGGSIIQRELQNADKLYILAIFNSLVLNYYLRLKVSANLNMFFIKELPVPSIGEELKVKIVDRASELVYTPKLTHLGKQFDLIDVIIGEERFIKRAELEVILARDVFKLSRDDFAYICSTFTYGREESPTKMELEEIKEITLNVWGE